MHVEKGKYYYCQNYIFLAAEDYADSIFGSKKYAYRVTTNEGSFAKDSTTNNIVLREATHEECEYLKYLIENFVNWDSLLIETGITFKKFLKDIYKSDLKENYLIFN